MPKLHLNFRCNSIPPSPDSAIPDSSSLQPWKHLTYGGSYKKMHVAKRWVPHQLAPEPLYSIVCQQQILFSGPTGLHNCSREVSAQDKGWPGAGTAHCSQ